MRHLTQTAGLIALLAAALPLNGTPPFGSLVGARLNADLSKVVTGDVQAGIQVSSDGNWLLYIADGEVDGRFELFAGPADLSSSPIRLNADLGPDQRVRRARFTPDSALVVYQVSDTIGTFSPELYSVPPDASQPPVLISPAGITSVSAWEVAPDSSCVVLDTYGTGGAAIYSADVHGTGMPIVLTGTPSLNISWGSQRFEISPDSSFVVFEDAEQSDTIELYRVPINGGARTRLGHALASPFGVHSFQLSPDATRVVYRGFVLTVGITDLFSAPADGSGSPTRLNQSFPLFETVFDFEIDPTSSHVLYSSDNFSHRTDLYTVPIAGGTPVQLTQHGPGGDLLEFVIDPGGGRVVFVADMETNDREELYSSLIDGSQPVVKLNGPVGTFGEVSPNIQIAPDSSWVAYRMRADTPQLAWHLEVAPIDGALPPVVLDTGSIRPQDGFEVLPDGSRIAFRGFNGVAPDDATMNTIRPDGSAFLTLSSPSAGVGGVEEFVVLPDSSAVFYRSDQDADEVFDVYRAPVDASTTAVRATGSLAIGGNVVNFRISPDGLWTVYQADQDADEVFELYTVPTDASSPPVKLNEELATGSGGVGSDFLPTGDSSRVVYREDRGGAGLSELYSTSIDGSGVPLELNAPLATNGSVVGYSLAPDGNTVVYLAQNEPARNELYAVPSDGSSAAVLIYSPLSSGGHVSDFVFTPAGDEVVYRAAEDGAFDFGLYVAPLDGSDPGTRISGPLVTGGDVSSSYACSASGRTVFLADADTDGMQEIYSVPTDGSRSPVKLNPSIPAIADIQDFAIADELGLVVYTFTDGPVDLFSVPIDGSQPPLRLNGSTFPRNVREFELTPDGELVVYRAVATLNNHFELFSVPTAGGAAPTRLNPPIGTTQSVVGFGSGRPFAISSEGKWVVFRGDLNVDEQFELFTAPADGSAPAARLSPEALGADRDVGDFMIGANNRVLYTADLDSPGSMSLYKVGVRGLGETLRVNPAFPAFASIRPNTFATPNFQFTPDGRQVHYIANPLQEGAFELFTTQFEPRSGGTRIRSTSGPVLDGGDRRL
jgi:Tol biopolymer transport system component